MGVWFENYAQGEFSHPPIRPDGDTSTITSDRSNQQKKKVGEYSLGAPQSYQRLHVPQRCASHTPRVLMLLEVCKVRFYNLHRTFVTLTLQSGVDMKTASGILGRYSAGFTLDTYPYVTTAAQKTTEKIINILKS